MQDVVKLKQGLKKLLLSIAGGLVAAYTFCDDKLYAHRLKTRKVRTRRELVALAHNSHRLISQREAAMVEGVLKQCKTNLAKLMRPLAEVPIVAIDEPLSPQKVDQLFHTKQQVFLVSEHKKLVGSLQLPDLVDVHILRETVGEALSALPPTISLTASLYEAAARCAELEAAALLVIDEHESPVGLLTIGQLLQHFGLTK